MGKGGIELMLSKEEIETKKYERIYLQEPIRFLTKENLERLEEHCKRAIFFERGRIKEEHELVLELLHRFRELESREQKLMAKLIEDKKQLTEELKYNITKREARLQLQLVDKYLKILKGEDDA